MRVQWLECVKGSLMAGLILFVMGCTQTQPRKEQSAMIIWKSPGLRYADMGFVSESGKMLQVEIYGSGVALMRLKIESHMICMSRFSCLSKARFNQTFLSSHYPAETLENIFRGKPLFGGMAMRQKSNGFTQTFQKTNGYAIEYTVLKNRIIFRDTINQIVIKVIKQ